MSVADATKFSRKFNLDVEKVEKALVNIQEKGVNFFAFSGKLGSGKDTIAPVLFDSLGVNSRVQHSFGLPLKNEANEVFSIIRSSEGFNDAVDSTVAQMGVDLGSAYQMVSYVFDEVLADRKLTAFNKIKNVRSSLQWWGTDVRRKDDNNYWVKLTMKSIVDDLANGEHVYLTDARFPNEADSVVEMGGKVVRLNVSDEEQARRIFNRDGTIVTDEARQHPSETSLDDYPDFCAIVDTDNRTPLQIAEIIMEKF